MKPVPLKALALLLGLTACIPGPGHTPPASAKFVVRISSGEVEGLSVDWAIFPDEGWPVEGRRDHTPFQTELPAGRVAAMFRPTLPGAKLEVVVLRRQPDGSLKRVSGWGALPLAVVVVEPKAELPSILSSAEPTVLGALK